MLSKLMHYVQIFKALMQIFILFFYIVGIQISQIKAGNTPV